MSKRPAHSKGQKSASVTPLPRAASAFVQLATVLRGVQPLAEKGFNDSFRGQLMLGDGTIRAAIIKDLDPKQLANELMVAALAHAAGLPIPGAHLAMALPGAMTANKGPTLLDGVRLVFGSADAQTPPVAQLYKGKDATVQAKVRQRIAEWDGVGSLYGFDSWVANTDRHESNLLFSGDKEVWLIDHGHCFTGPNWTPANFDPAREYANKLKGWLTPAMSESRRATVAGLAATLPENVKDLDLEKIGEINHVMGILDRGEFDALVAFLKARNSHVPRLAAAALNINLAV